MKLKSSFIIIIILLILILLILPRGQKWNQIVSWSFLSNRKGSSIEAEKIAAAFPCVPSPLSYEFAMVRSVIDGDSILVDIDGQEVEVRYIGVDAPEMTGRGHMRGSDSKTANQSLVEGRDVLLYKDVTQTDRYGRLLRYVFVDSIFVNYQLVLDGHAYAKSYPPDVACQLLLKSAQQ